MRTIELLDAVKAKHNLPSDYALAPLLGLTRSQVSKYRNRKDFMGDDVAARAANLAGADPLVCIADCHAERAASPETAALWRQIAKRLQAVAAVLALAILIGLPGYVPDASAFELAMTPLFVPLYIMSTFSRHFEDTFGSSAGTAHRLDCHAACPRLGRSTLPYTSHAMTDNTENIILEHLKRFQTDMNELKRDSKEILSRISHLEIGMAAVRRDIAHADENSAILSARMDRINERIERIERRLELA